MKWFGKKDELDWSKKEKVEVESFLEKVRKYEKEYLGFNEIDFKEKTKSFKTRLIEGETVEDIKAEAFALVRTAATQVLKMTHYDEQIMGAYFMTQRMVVEMKTGEGKTLVSTLPAYLRALEGQGVHIATANDYLAERDAEWMGTLYGYLGLSVGVVKSDSGLENRREAYNCDITYGTAIEFGFDYLRNNLVYETSELFQRPPYYCLVDEADSILIDEAKTPITISTAAPLHPEEYQLARNLSDVLVKDTHYTLDVETEKATLTDEGITKAEEYLGIENLYDPSNVLFLIKIQNALTVKEFVKLDKDYVIENGQMVLIDPHTGRLAYGRKMPTGLQQAVESKEGIEITPELVMKAMITYQNYFRLYKQLSGMTGTAKTEEQELEQVYGLKVRMIPTKKPVIREDLPDICFKTKEVKFNYIVSDIEKRHQKEQPILVGTESIETSLMISERLQNLGIPHEVLHAKNHEEEARIIEGAGQKKAITIVSNMAGRGTDIKLADGVAEIGGLHVIGTTRHESRRVDNQLRGRSGRQGDPGSSQYFVSLEDDIVEKFGGTQVKSVLDRLRVKEELPIEHKLVTKLLEQVQISCEVSNQKLREVMLNIDDILNNQRSVIYENRNSLLFATGSDFKEQVFMVYHQFIEEAIKTYCSDELSEEWDMKGLCELINTYLFEEDYIHVEDFEDFTTDEAYFNHIYNRYTSVYERKSAFFGEELFADIVRPNLLHILDSHWLEYLSFLGYLQSNLNFKYLAGGNVLLNYSIECFEMFSEFKQELQREFVKNTLLLEFVFTPPDEESTDVQTEPENA